METTCVLCLKTNKINIENWKNRSKNALPYLSKKKKRLFKKSARQFNDQFLLWRCHCKQAFPVISVYVLAFSGKRKKVPIARWLVTVYWANIRVWTRNSCSTSLVQERYPKGFGSFFSPFTIPAWLSGFLPALKHPLKRPTKKLVCWG